MFILVRILEVNLCVLLLASIFLRICLVNGLCILPFSQAPKKAKRRQQQGEGGSSNVFSMFEQSQIQEYKEVTFFLFLLVSQRFSSNVN